MSADRWQFEAADGETYIVETEAIRDDTIVRIKRRDGMGVELSYKWSESLLVQALLALVEQPEPDDLDDDLEYEGELPEDHEPSPYDGTYSED